VRGHLLPILTVAAVAAGLAAVTGTGTAFGAPTGPLYVDNSPDAHCSDSGGGTQSQPYCTISAAVAVVVPGQTVNVLGTSFAEHVTIARSGLAGQPITIRRGPGAVRLTGPTAGLTIAGQHDVVVDGIDVTPASDAVAVDVSNSARIALQGFETTCVFAQPGVRFTGVTDSSVTGAQTCGVVLDAATSGVRLKTIDARTLSLSPVGIDVAGSDNTITGTILASTAVNGVGIRLEPGAAGNVLVNNDIYRERTGIDNNGATGTTITNNTLDEICTGIRVAGASSHVSVENNLVSDNRTPFVDCAAPLGVNIGIYDDATRDTVVDYNGVVRVDGSRRPYAWQTPMDSLVQFQAVSGQAAHDTENAPSLWNIDSANSAAPGFPSTDSGNRPREDDPDVPNTGAGPISYADRGASELVRGPSISLALTMGQDALSLIADASGTRPGWVPVVSYAFNFGDGSPVVTQAAPVATHRYANPGTYAVSVIATDAKGQTDGTVVQRTLLRAIRTVALLARADNRYVSAESAGHAPLIANRATAGAWEAFDLVQPDATHLALRSRVNGKYIEVETDNTGYLSVYSDTVGPGALFQLVTNADGTVSMLWSGGKYVTAEAAGSQPLAATRSAIGPWEKFNLVDVANTTVSLRAHANNRYVTAESGGDQPLIANRTGVGAWEQFDLVDAGNGTVALYSHANGRFVTAESAGTQPLVANRTGIGAWERFTVVKNADGSISLLANADGRYVTADSAGTRPLIANRTAIGQWEEFDLSR
jgi:hypothetical protein